MNNKFLKLSAAEDFLAAANKKRFFLLQDLIDNATDDVIVMRRFRMLAQLSEFEGQALKKIYQFDTTDPKDYHQGLNQLLGELESVSSKNA
jgi:predicted component of type VI protein secretion system